MKIVVDREIFHHMMRGIAGGFQHASLSGANQHRMKLTAEKLAHATAAGELTVEVNIGGPFPAIVSLRPGDKLTADAGFNCIKKDEVVTVEQDAHGLFVKCSEGNHYLEGQEGDSGECVGLKRLGVGETAPSVERPA